MQVAFNHWKHTLTAASSLKNRCTSRFANTPSPLRSTALKMVTACTPGLYFYCCRPRGSLTASSSVLRIFSRVSGADRIFLSTSPGMLKWMRTWRRQPPLLSKIFGKQRSCNSMNIKEQKANVELGLTSYSHPVNFHSSIPAFWLMMLSAKNVVSSTFSMSIFLRSSRPGSFTLSMGSTQLIAYLNGLDLHLAGKQLCLIPCECGDAIACHHYKTNRRCSPQEATHKLSLP